jgi:hypothetical protein
MDWSYKLQLATELDRRLFVWLPFIFFDSTRLDSTRLNSTRLDSTRLDYRYTVLVLYLYLYYFYYLTDYVLLYSTSTVLHI